MPQALKINLLTNPFIPLVENFLEILQNVWQNLVKLLCFLFTSIKVEISILLANPDTDSVSGSLKSVLVFLVGIGTQKYRDNAAHSRIGSRYRSTLYSSNKWPVHWVAKHGSLATHN